VPHNYAVGTGSFHDVSPDSAFWIFNRVANFAYLRYSDMIVDIQVAQRELESRFLASQKETEAAALVLYEQAPRLAKDYLTDYSLAAAGAVIERWKKLDDFLLYKYLDGNLKTEKGEVTHPGYPEAWYEMVAQAQGDQLQVRKLRGELEREEQAKEQTRRIAQGVLTLLESRGIALDDEQRKRVSGSEDRKELEAWLTRAATADAAADLFASE
jgi:hypothetical protein